MNLKSIAEKYISYLGNEEVEKLVSLFSSTGKVKSPIYGIKSAKDFYTKLFEDTKTSELTIKNIFEDKVKNEVALFFTFRWTLINKSIVEFDVVDILEFNNNNEIELLTILYDTAIARSLVKNLT